MFTNFGYSKVFTLEVKIWEDFIFTERAVLLKDKVPSLKRPEEAHNDDTLIFIGCSRACIHVSRGNAFNMTTILGELNKPNTKPFHKRCALLNLVQHRGHYHTCNVVSPLTIHSTHHSPICSSDNNNTSPHSWKTSIYPYTAPPIMVAHVQHVALLPTNITPQHPLKFLQPYQHISQTPDIYTHLSTPIKPIAPPLGDPTHGTYKTIATTFKRMDSPSS